AKVTDMRLQRADRRALQRGRAGTPSGALYRLDWRQTPLTTMPPTRPAGAWVVVAGAGSKAAIELSAQIKGCILTDPAGLGAALDSLASGAGMVCLWEAHAEETTPIAAQRIATEGLSVVQALRGRAPARLLWVTRGAIAVATSDGV